MKYIILLLSLSIVMNTSAQQVNKKIMDPNRNQEILINLSTRPVLIEFPGFKDRYDLEYPNYKTDSLTLVAIKPLMKDKKVTLVMGTWCGDSKLQVPHFYKMIDDLSIPEKEVTLICVDGTKKAENGLIDKLNIERVPTFIIYENGKELGRIVESPKISLEKDLLEILSKK